MAHIHEKIDFTASVYVVHGDVVLLRVHDKYKAWFPPGGHIELDEDPNQGALREVREEVGLTVTLIGDMPPQQEGEGYQALIPPRFMNRHKVGNTEHVHVDLIYFAHSKNKEVIELVEEREKSPEIRWFTKEELEDPRYGIRETIKHYALIALKEA